MSRLAKQVVSLGKILNAYENTSVSCAKYSDFPIRKPKEAVPVLQNIFVL